MQLGKFEILEELGQGGFGIVYKARDLYLEREVALKVLHPQLTIDTRFIENFKREARNLAKINHPNVVTIHEIGEVEGRIYIAMRYLPGGSLADKLKQGGKFATLEPVLKIVREVAAGLEAGHKRSIIHRDVKPGNILFDEEGQAVIADFGVARAVQTSTLGTFSETGGTVGTPYYRPPELWRGEPPPSPASDIYSLACVVYEMLSGMVLFSGDTPEQVLTKHVLEDASSLMDKHPVSLPAGVRSVLLSALAKDPAQRYQALPDFYEALQAGTQKGHKARLPAIKEKSPAAKSDAKPTPKQPPSRKTPAAGQSGKRPGWVWWGVGGAVFVVGLLAVLGIAWLLKNIIGPPSTPVPTHSSTETQAPTNIETPRYNAGDTQTREKDGMVQVYIPAGSFMMGSEDGDSDEKPVHQVTLSDYWMDKHEVSNAQYAQFLNEEGNQSEGGATWLDAADSDVRINNVNGVWQPLSEYADHPVVEVSWYGARAYCEWAGGDLPTEAQWEYAARGTDGRIYPWGNQSPSCDLANMYNSATSSYCVGDTTPVNNYPAGASFFGVFNMAGNVWEWVADWYGSYSSASQPNPGGPASGDFRVLRGGSWYSIERSLRAADRNYNIPDDTNYYYGFRCFTQYPAGATSP